MISTSKIVIIAVLLVVSLSIGIGLTPASADKSDPWQMLENGGFIILIRHALAPGFGDPAHFRLDDCTTQRNLSEEGRQQAQALGDAFRRQQIPIEKVYSSQWCRCKDTAHIAFGAFEDNPVLNSFFEQPGLRASQTETLIDFLQTVRPRQGNLILVTHQVTSRPSRTSSPHREKWSSSPSRTAAG